jgi:DNA-binding YbaB/EbfC family protein
MMKNLSGMMKKVQELQGKMEALQEDMANRSFTASVGGGTVSATVTGKGVVTDMVISADVCASGDTELLTELVMLAVNTAKSDADRAQEEAMKHVTGGLPLPPGMKLPF